MTGHAFASRGRASPERYEPDRLARWLGRQHSCPGLVDDRGRDHADAVRNLVLRTEIHEIQGRRADDRYDRDGRHRHQVSMSGVVDAHGLLP
jgi:hypothetical protein